MLGHPTCAAVSYAAYNAKNIINKHNIQIEISKKGEYLACKDIKLPKSVVLHVVDQLL